MLATGGLMLCRPSQPLAYSQGISLHSDLHIGSPQFDELLLKRELKQAHERGDRLAFNGDIFDAILTSDKKRFRPGAVHPRLQGSDDILGLAKDWAEELLAPYVDAIDMIGIGNHDDTVVKHHSSCPVSDLVKRLQRHVTSPRHVIHFGGYTGFLRYQLPRSKRARKWHRSADTLTIFYWHGAGGGGSIGTSLSEFASKGMFIEQADVHWFAHRHLRLAVPVERLSCPASGEIPASRTLWYVRTAAYLKSYDGQSQASWRQKGRKANYGADALHQPFGRGGVRLVVAEEGATNKLRFQVD